MRILYTCLVLMAAIVGVDARTPMRNWLVAMPDSTLSLLTKNNRLDFIDFYDAKMEAIVTNRMEGKSRMDTLTDDFVLINYTKSAEVAMKLLPVNDTAEVLCMVTTMNAGVDDSRIAFFDSQWNELDAADYIEVPCMDDFRTELQNDSLKWIWSKMDVFFRTFHLCAQDTGLKCVLTATDYLSEEDREVVAPYVRKDPIIYRWTDGKYVRYE